MNSVPYSYKDPTQGVEVKIKNCLYKHTTKCFVLQAIFKATKRVVLAN